MSSFSAPSFYLSPSKAALQLQYVGKNLNDVPTPAAVLDLAPIRRNCKAMLEATKALGLGFRAHVKTHKVRRRILIHDRHRLMFAKDY